MIEQFIPLLASMLPLWYEYLLPIFGLGFLATVPCVIRILVLRR